MHQQVNLCYQEGPLLTFDYITPGLAEISLSFKLTKLSPELFVGFCWALPLCNPIFFTG